MKDVTLSIWFQLRPMETEVSKLQAGDSHIISNIDINFTGKMEIFLQNFQSLVPQVCSESETSKKSLTLDFLSPLCVLSDLQYWI